MDPYEAGFATGQLMFTVCCIVTVLGAIGAAIWGAVAYSHRSRPRIPPPAYPAPPPYPPPAAPPHQQPGSWPR